MTSYKIVLVGQPNAGKSTLFNVLSDIKAAAGNFAGTSVRITQSAIQLEGRVFQLLDLPGTYSLNAVDDAEKITRDYLLHEKIDLVVNVVDSTLLARSLELTGELLELGLPLVVALNMQDEAEKRGLKIDHEKLEQLLGVPVVPTAALHGKGVRSSWSAACACSPRRRSAAARCSPTRPISKPWCRNWPQAMPLAGARPNGSRRFYAIKAIENPDMVPERRCSRHGRGDRRRLRADPRFSPARML